MSHNRTPVRTGSGSSVQEPPPASPDEDLWLEALPCPAPERAGQIASCPLDPGATAPGAARDFTRQILGSWGLLVLAEDAAVIVSELVTNAVRHGVRDTNGPGHDRVELILLRRPGQMLCAVTDPGAEPPVLAAPELCAEAGRGLHVIEALAAAWGWTRLDARNKAVWAALSVSGVDGGGPPGPPALSRSAGRRHQPSCGVPARRSPISTRLQPARRRRHMASAGCHHRRLLAAIRSASAPATTNAGISGLDTSAYNATNLNP